MPFANQKNSSKKTALIAGTGELPKIVLEHLGQAFVVSFEGSLNESVAANFTCNMGQIGAVLAKLKEVGAEQVVFAGGINKPKIRDLKLDKEASKLLAKIATAKLFGKLPGDDAIFKAILKYLDNNGVAVVGVDEVVPSLLAEKGVLGAVEPTAEQLASIEIGKKAAKELGKKDIGQAVVVCGNEVVAREDDSGTDAMLQSVAKTKHQNAILLKCKKPQQDRRIDLPSIGVKTIERLAQLGFAGVAVEAGDSIVIQKNAVVTRANELGIFVLGI